MTVQDVSATAVRYEPPAVAAVTEVGRPLIGICYTNSCSNYVQRLGQQKL